VGETFFFASSNLKNNKKDRSVGLEKQNLFLKLNKKNRFLNQIKKSHFVNFCLF